MPAVSSSTCKFTKQKTQLTVDKITEQLSMPGACGMAWDLKGLDSSFDHCYLYSH